MNRWKKIGIAGAIVLASAASIAIHSPQIRSLPIFPKEEVVIGDQKKKLFLEYGIAYQREFFGGDGKFRGYVDLMSDAGLFFNPVRKNVGEMGRPKVVEGLVGFHAIPLEWAVQNYPRSPSKEELKRLGDAMRSHQFQTGKQMFINPEYGPYVESFQDFAADRIGFYQRVMAGGISNPGEFKEMIARVRGKSGFIEDLARYKEARQNFYKQTAESIKTYEDKNPFFQATVRKFGPSIALLYMESSDVINDGEFQRIFGNAK